MKVAVTGPPGVGKTTLALKVAETARGVGLDVRGFVTVELREGGQRVGFDILRLADGARAPLARVGPGEPRVGKYVVLLSSCDFIVSALREAGDLLIVDEVGAMEAKCAGFLNEAKSAIERSARALAVVHLRYVGAARGWGLKIYSLTKDNREQIFNEVVKLLLQNV